MKKETIMKKLFFVNNHVISARNAKDWKSYEAAVIQYTRLLNILKTMEAAN